jgi:hypothetical protein
VHILAGTNRPGIQLVVRSPDGATAVFGNPAPTPPGALGGGRLTAHWLSDRTLDVTIEPTGAGGWSGQWSVVFVDPAGSPGQARGRVQLRITGDLVPALVDADRLELHTGAVVPLRFGLLSETTRQPVPPAQVPGVATLAAELRASGGRLIAVAAGLGKGDLDRSFPLDLHGVPTGAATLRVTLSVRTADLQGGGGTPATPGTRLTDRVVDVPLTVLPPVNYPRVLGRVDFHRGEGPGPFTASLAVTGPGCVWVDGQTVAAAPDGVGTVSVAAATASRAGSCAAVAAGSRATLPLRLRLQHPGTGTVAGTVTVPLAPVGDPQRAVTAEVPFLADVVKPAAEPVRVSVLVAALLLGLGGPVLFLYGAKWWTARIPGLPLLGGTVPAVVRDGNVLRDGRPFAVTHDDVAYVAVPPGGTRRLVLDGGRVTLATRVGGRPTAAGYTLVGAEGMSAVTDGPHASSGRRGSTRLPLAVHNRWVALIADPARDDVDVLVLVSGSAGPATYARISEQVRTSLPGLVARVRAEAARTGASDTASATASGAGAKDTDWFAGSATQPSAGRPGTPTGTDWWEGS